MPLMPISRDPADEYANVKPFASCTIEFDEDDSMTVTLANAENLKRVKEAVTEAYNQAGEAVFMQIKEFSEEFRDLYKPTPSTKTKKAGK
jgi:hypothetical protein